MIALLFFLLLSPAIWRIWATEHFVQAEAHRDVFHKLTVPVDLAVDGTLWGAANPVRPAGQSFSSLPNTLVEGWEGKEFTYGSGFGFHGDMRISRSTLAIRSPWTITDWPYTSKQVTTEAALVETWYGNVKTEAMSIFPNAPWGPYGDIKSGLKLEDSVLTLVVAKVKDKVKDRAKKFLKKVAKGKKKKKEDDKKKKDDDDEKKKKDDDDEPPETHETPPSPKSPPIDDTPPLETNPTPPSPKSPD
jgi:hypothetical protein